jgi:pimeloyl-ACP methyl ester carboxylesterase
MARNVTDLGQVVPGPVALVGWSWGAMWALSFAARYPGRVRTLVLVGCGTYDQDARGRYRAALERRLGPSRLRELAAGLAGTEAQRRRAFAHLGRTVAEAESFDPIPGRGRDPGMAALDPRGFDETWRDVLRRQRDGREPAAFRAIRCPVLMIHGRQDPHPGSRIAESLRPYLPQLVYRPLDRCGHTPWRERQAKEPFLWLLERWLERSDASARLPTPGR